MKHRLTALALALVTSFSIISVATAPTALAGECSAWNVCGKFYNRSNVGIGIVHHWGGSQTRTLWPGQYSRSFWADTDGVYRGWGWCATATIYTSSGTGRLWLQPGWNKIRDNWYLHYLDAWRC